MLRPKYPTAPVPTQSTYPPAVHVPTAVETHHAPGCACQHPYAPAPSAPPPARRMSPGGIALAIAGGTTAVLVIGAVLVSMLLAVAITACAVTGCLLVLRSLLTNASHDSTRYHH